ncbi:hypothetical protein B5V03_10525 [Bradyrhizobium betae]|uniref:Uncharacterized protein n=1 Tax=Bradyrhizobium betae TaxID=244734 RepID=A0A4Q1VDY6_9BRAD|nr:hypothetical protein B5V03_10525 [Bradyrhizobium betae]
MAVDILAASAVAVFTAVASVPHRPFTAAAIATADFATMAVIIATGFIARITATATSTGAIITAAIIPPITIRAAAGSSGPITARAASAAGIAGTIRIAIGKHDRHEKGAPTAPFVDVA